MIKFTDLVEESYLDSNNAPLYHYTNIIQFIDIFEKNILNRGDFENPINKENLKIIHKSCLIPMLSYYLTNINVSNFELYLYIVQISVSIFELDNSLNNPLQQFNNYLKNYMKHYSTIGASSQDVEYNVLNKLSEVFKNITFRDNNDSKNEYNSILYKYQFGEAIISISNEYKNYVNKIKLSPINTKLLLKEIYNLNTALPLCKESSIFIRFDPNKLGIFRFIITGPADTPYDSGCFLFEMLINENYPNSPPYVKLLTTGNGKVRFNPNLYDTGKVCLSLLGTWTSGTSSESWIAGVSTMLQVMISIQSLILIEDPYYNEPAYESYRNKDTCKHASNTYNETIKTNNIQYAMIDMIKNPPLEFKDVILNHFKFKKDYIIDQIKKWNIKEVQAKELITLLNKL